MTSSLISWKYCPCDCLRFNSSSLDILRYFPLIWVYLVRALYFSLYLHFTIVTNFICEISSWSFYVVRSLHQLRMGPTSSRRLSYDRSLASSKATAPDPEFIVVFTGATTSPYPGPDKYSSQFFIVFICFFYYYAALYVRPCKRRFLYIYFFNKLLYVSINIILKNIYMRL